MADTKLPLEQLTTTLRSNLNELIELIVTGKDPPVGCEKCDQGQIKIEKSFGWDIKMCECYDRQQMFKDRLFLFSESNVTPAELKRYSLAKYKSDRLDLESLVDYAAGNTEKEWLYLYGGPGTGKTYTAVLIALFAMAAGRSALYVNMPDLLELMRPGREEEVRKNWLNMCRKVDVLILDDIGQEKNSEWVSERLYLIVNNRYRDGKNTVFTSNFALDDLKVSKAIASRMAHLAQIINFKNNDKRTVSI